MADSDDEYDGRRRDNTKFVRERSDYSSSNRSNLGGWQQSDQWSSHRPSSNYQQRGHDSYGSGIKRDRHGNPAFTSSNYEPQAKRNRLTLNHWSDDRPQHQQHQSNSYESNYDNSYNRSDQNELLLTQPAYMSFKQFMRGLDDSIDHLEAAKRYNEYKLDFKRKQITEFFNTHKDEEWFRIKFHPVDSVKRKKELRGYVKHRAQAFFDLYNKGIISSTTVDIEKSDQITNVLDSIVIKLEGGTDYDLKCLETVSKDESTEATSAVSEPTAGDATAGVAADDDQKKQASDESMAVENGEHADSEKTKESESEQIKQEEGDTLEEDTRQTSPKPPAPSTQEDQEMTGDESKKDDELAPNPSREDGEADESMDSTQHTAVDSQQHAQATSDQAKAADSSAVEINNNSSKIDNKELTHRTEDENAPRPLHKTLSIFLRYLPANVTKSEVVKMFKAYDGYLRVALADPTFDKRFQRRGWVTFDRKVDIRKIYLSLANAKIRDCEFGAIINRDLSRRIRSVNGIASHRNCVLADLKHTTRIILNLDEERSVFEESDDERQQSQTNSTSSAATEQQQPKSEAVDQAMDQSAAANDEQQQALSNDDQTAAKNGDETDQQSTCEELAPKAKKEVIEEKQPIYKVEGLPEKITVFGQATRNPLLVDVEQFLKEKSSAAIESVNDETGEIKEEEPADELEPKPLERDEEMIKMLDKLVFYLRVVHSLDFYNHVDYYPNEDEMPNRIGILHARGMVPTANITLKEVNDYIKQFESRITPYLERSVPLSDDEVVKLGKRKVEDEIEKFITDNTKELKADKWLCPLCNKKFKGPSFVRKHIETKHQDELENVRQETEFFNAYLAEPRRPQLAEHPQNRPGYRAQQSLPQNQSHSSGDHYSSSNSHSNYGSVSNVHQRVNFGGQGGNRYQSGGNWNNNNNNSYNNYRNGGNRFQRKQVYRDLDAPTDY